MSRVQSNTEFAGTDAICMGRRRLCLCNFSAKLRFNMGKMEYSCIFKTVVYQQTKVRFLKKYGAIFDKNTGLSRFFAKKDPGE